MRREFIRGLILLGVVILIVWGFFLMTEGTIIDIVSLDYKSGDTNPVWLPDGRISFLSDRDTRGVGEIYIMNSDGTNVKRITNDEKTLKTLLSSSPDGRMMAFQSYNDICIIKADGSGFMKLAKGTDPSWSPDSKTISFWDDEDIYLIDNDGANLRKITNSGKNQMCSNPTWSPDGKSISFLYFRDGSTTDVCVMKTDGSDIRNLTNDGVGKIALARSPTGPDLSKRFS